MQVKAFKSKLVEPGDNLEKVIEQAIPSLEEKSIVVVTSKIISYAQNKLVEFPGEDEKQRRLAKQKIVRQEADYYLEPHTSKYDLMVTIKDSIVAVNAGLDESNAVDGKLVLWPENLQQETNKIWSFLRQHYGVKDVGVIVTDSKTTPQRWGVVGISVTYCGFKPLYSYIGKEDLFGRKLEMEQLNIADSMAAFAVMEMGEGAEQTPLAVVTDIADSKIKFQDRVPTNTELDELRIELENDVYEPFLSKAEWKKGRV